jgi:uncharacterized protein with NRDE domain
MCLIAFALHASARWPLVIAANRDEFLDRPTVPLARWKTPAGQVIVSGRDLRAGGAWFGVTSGGLGGPIGPGGRIAFLTNVREAEALPAPRSRGELVTRWLESQIGAEKFVAGLAADPTAFAGFNLVVGSIQRDQWHWVTNRPSQSHLAKALHYEALRPGIYGLSNAALDSPWPKTTQLKDALGQSLRAHEAGGDLAALRADLWHALGSRERAEAAHLPRTGIPLAREEALSSAFVEMPEHGYGTRSSTLLTASAGAGGWEVQMEEREHLREAVQPGQVLNQDWQVRRESFHWPLASAILSDLPSATAA